MSLTFVMVVGVEAEQARLVLLGPEPTVVMVATLPFKVVQPVIAWVVAVLKAEILGQAPVLNTVAAEAEPAVVRIVAAVQIAPQDSMAEVLSLVLAEAEAGVLVSYGQPTLKVMVA